MLGSTWYIVGGGNNAAGCADMYVLDLGVLGRGEPLVWTLVGNTPPSSAIASEGLRWGGDWGGTGGEEGVMTRWRAGV